MSRPRTESKIGTTAESIYDKASAVIRKSQQILGRAPGNKTQYMATDFESTLGKKHVRSVSVVLYIMFVSIFAIYLGIYYAAYWEPNTRILFTKRSITKSPSC